MNAQKYFAWGAIIFVAAAIIAAFFVVGSPARQRQLRFDERRVSDLQEIQYQVARYFGSKGELPERLEDIQGFESFSVPVDPETSGKYEYIVQAPNAFRLCADFSLPTPEGSEIGGPPYRHISISATLDGEQIWRHSAGQGCFDVILEMSTPENIRDTFPSATVRPAS